VDIAVVVESGEVAEESASEDGGDGGDGGDAASSNTTFFIELFSPSLIIFADHLIPYEACIDCWGLIVLKIMHVVLAQDLHAWSLGASA